MYHFLFFYFRYEKRIIEIYKKICKITEEPDFLDEPELRFNETNNKLVNLAIQKYYNRNKTFPDYYEIYTLLKLLQQKKKINWTESQLKNICKYKIKCFKIVINII